MGIAWVVGFTIYFIKKWKRKNRKAKVAVGLALPKKKKETGKPDEKIIVPPDPAIFLGHRRPGENAFLDDARSPRRGPSPSTTPSGLPVEQKEVTSEPPSTVHQASHSALMERHNTSDCAANP
jgi:hypothetical protein